MRRLHLGWRSPRQHQVFLLYSRISDLVVGVPFGFHSFCYCLKTFTETVVTKGFIVSQVKILRKTMIIMIVMTMVKTEGIIAGRVSTR